MSLRGATATKQSRILMLVEIASLGLKPLNPWSYSTIARNDMQQDKYKQ